jgi:hypothetical protein
MNVNVVQIVDTTTVYVTKNKMGLKFRNTEKIIYCLFFAAGIIGNVLHFIKNRIKNKK